MSTRIRFLLNGNTAVVVDGEPGPGEVARSVAEAWAEAGVPMEFVEDAPAADVAVTEPTRQVKKRRR